MDGSDTVSPPVIEWHSDVDFAVGGVSFHTAPWGRFTSTEERFCIVKPPDLVGRYVELIADLEPKTIIELGIFGGGSTALLAQLTDPTQLVALDITAQRVAALDAFIASHSLADRVRAFFGIDQSDVATVDQIVSDCFGDQPIDLIIDDASHDLAHTRASFNLLFPRVRPGGVFIIEDWAWAHVGYSAQRPGDPSLARLVFEVVLACPSAPGLIESVTIDRHWALIRRSTAAIDPNGFDIAGVLTDRSRSIFTPEERPSA